MATKDIRSNLKQVLAMVRQQIGTGDTTPVNGGIIDTAEFDLGLMFGIVVDTFVAAGVTFDLQASDDPTFATGVTTYVDGDDELLGTLANLDAAANTAEVDDVSNFEGAGFFMKTIGLFSNPRYVRIRAVSDSTGDVFVTIVATQMGEVLPTLDV